jgi:hypothetical protein
MLLDWFLSLLACVHNDGLPFLFSQLFAIMAFSALRNILLGCLGFSHEWVGNDTGRLLEPHCILGVCME